ncbi:MAG: tetratricopeptide repeat protein [Gemmataceae bacterium]
MTTRRVLLILAVLLVLAGGAVGWRYWYRPAEPVLPPRVDLSEADDAPLQKAVEAARRRVLDNSGSASEWGALGKLLLANGYGDDSRACFSQAARLDPADARWPYLRGLAEQPISPDAAVPSFREAARLIGDKGATASVVRWRCAEALLRKGERQEAGTILRDLRRRDPNNPRVQLTLGILAFEENDLATARKLLLACASNPLTRQRAATRLAALSQLEGDSAAAERYQRLARRLPRDPDGPDPIAEEYKVLLVGRRAFLLRAEYLIRAGELVEAVALLRRLLEEHPDEAEASVKLGMALAELGQFRDAEQVLREGLRRGGERVQARYFLTVAVFHQAERSGNQARFEEAVEQARRVLVAKPDHAFAHLYLGLALEHLGQEKEALHQLEQAVRFSPESTDPHLHLGEALVKAGRRKEGFAHLDRAVELAGDADPRPRAARERLRQQKPK